jgi:hypothetical protein
MFYDGLVSKRHQAVFSLLDVLFFGKYLVKIRFSVFSASEASYGSAFTFFYFC